MMTAKLLLKLPPSVTGELDDVIKKYNINSPLRLSHFLSQAAHESNNFKAIRENLNYSAEGLLKIFPKYFSKDTAMACARQPEKIANIVYSNRMGNGDRLSGDGWKFRGRGFIQLTGKINYQSFGSYIGVNLIDNPDFVATKYPLTSAAWFFEKRGLWKICDEGDSIETIRKVTKMVNGGFNGLQDRINKFEVFNILLK
jgi:putative chitinase